MRNFKRMAITAFLTVSLVGTLFVNPLQAEEVELSADEIQELYREETMAREN